MQKLSVLALVAILLMFGSGSCKTEKEEMVLKGDEYFPVVQGTYKFYQVDSFFFNNFTGGTDSISHIYREEIKEKLVDGSGDTFYRVELSLFSSIKNQWEVRKTFSRKITGNYAIENLDNQPEVKLLFPISKYKTKGSGYSWNLNMLTGNDIINVKYASLFQSFSYYIDGNPNKVTYNDCVVVELLSPESGVVTNIRKEVYAKDKGLVYRHIDQSDTLSVLHYRNGFEVFVRLIP